jgi:hypothetical protein
MAKSNNRWDVIYETVDEQAHKIIPHFAAQSVDYKTALMVKRNHKKICAMEIRPTRRAADVCHVAAQSGIIQIKGSCWSHTRVTQTVSRLSSQILPLDNL